MPTYQYECQKCGHAFEVFQAMTAAALKVCPKHLCRRTPWSRGRVQRVIGGGAGLLFKGSGFHITDYRSDGYKQAASKESAPATTGAGDTKPAPAKTPAGSLPAPKPTGSAPQGGS